MRKKLKKEFAANMVIIISIVIMVFLVILFLVQINDVGKSVQKQTEINQRFLRRLILLPASDYQDREARIKAVDKCSVDSKVDIPKEVKSN